MKMLDYLMRSRVKIKILRHFMNNEQGIGTRELARQMREDSSNTLVALREMCKIGILEKVDDKYYAKNIELLTLLQHIDDTY